MYSRSFRALGMSLFMGVVSLLIPPNIAGAAGLDLVNITTIPQNPIPRESVTIEIESYAIDLNTANIAWMQNGEWKQDGIAKKEFTLIAPDFGEKAVIDIVILTKNGDKLDKQYIIAPAEVDILWEAQTYTPPFYKGKALPTFNSIVRITAIPRFDSLTSDPSQYYYKWTYNRISLAGEAQGKSSITIPMGFTKSQLQVIAEVSLAKTPWTGKKSVDIAVATPKVVLFENNPLLGVRLNRPLQQSGSISTKETELGLYAVPYFFSLDDLLLGNLMYTWEINKRYTSPGIFPRYLTLVKPESLPTTYDVSLRIQNPKRVLQEGQVKTAVTFSAE